VSVGQALLALREKDSSKFLGLIGQLRERLAEGLSGQNTSSIKSCHDYLLKFHALTEIESISGLVGRNAVRENPNVRQTLQVDLDRRLQILGAFDSDKQFLLSLRRATMQLSALGFSREELASVWLTSARLARKANASHQSFNAVLHASRLGTKSATIEHARLLWKEGHHRNAIQTLEGAIAAKMFSVDNVVHRLDSGDSGSSSAINTHQNVLVARAHLLLAKWLDASGQSQSHSIIEKYQYATKSYSRWEKCHYYLGRHYNKLYEADKALPPLKRSQQLINGEIAKLVITNYLRSLSFGAKYIFKTVPKLLTLWLDLGAEAELPVDPKYGNAKAFLAHLYVERKKQLDAINSALGKYIPRLPAFVFYTAFSQIIARICHPSRDVQRLLSDIIIKVVSVHPKQALWALLAVVKSSDKTRALRGAQVLAKVKDEGGGRTRQDLGSIPLRELITYGQKLSEQLLMVCDKPISKGVSNVSLTRDLAFQHKYGQCPLVIPLEATLSPTLPTIPDTMKTHRAFSSDAVSFSAFLDDVLVLNSLQRPRKINVKGTDGRIYGLLCKPKDDLRKDQRLMEFNSMINRALKKDADSSQRRLYIKTYAVTPLNEECGLLEWVDNLKTLRDIILHLYKNRGITMNYTEIRTLLDEACSGKDKSKFHIFDDKILPAYPPVFHEWFVQMFPEPSAWFTARLRYTRSAAVMSMVGMVLGLGDRHGENILFEEGNGGTFHVDFNCLFDKGLTFEKPERVPFRLTQNMVDAFGVYGYEGPFRKSCELTLRILRQNEDTLMTILETFLYDPTTDFLGPKKKRNVTNVPETPQEVLDSVQSKVKGLMRGESVPLSVEGQVLELIQQAVSTENLASMYIGWCSWF
jgi:serine/threonine-protein kinase ATR